jgi:hypothetical protein
MPILCCSYCYHLLIDLPYLMHICCNPHRHCLCSLGLHRQLTLLQPLHSANGAGAAVLGPCYALMASTRYGSTGFCTRTCA